MKLGEGKFSRYVKEAFNTIDVVEEGVRKHMTAHRPRELINAYLCGAEFHFQIIEKKRGFQDPRSALWYHNSDGILGQQLHVNMFGESIDKAKIGVDVENATRK